MAWTSMIAVYALFWVMSAFVLLPFGVKTSDEMGIEKVPGQAESAPANFQPGKVVIRATIISVVLTVLWILNWEYEWIGADAINIFGQPDHYQR